MVGGGPDNNLAVFVYVERRHLCRKDNENLTARPSLLLNHWTFTQEPHTRMELLGTYEMTFSRALSSELLSSFNHTHTCCWLLLLFSCYVVSKSLWPRGLSPTRLLSPWDFPAKNTGVGCHFLLQGIFSTQGSNPHLLQWQADSLPLNHHGSVYMPLIWMQVCQSSINLLTIKCGWFWLRWWCELCTPTSCWLCTWIRASCLSWNRAGSTLQSWHN